jgi:mxaA protein
MICRVVLRGVLALLAVAGCRAGAVDTVDRSIQPVVAVRDTGYLLGDLLDERIDLSLPGGFSLDAGSLPAPGRVAPWLEVRSARIVPGLEPGGTGVVVTYQIFAEVEEASRVPIPAFKLRVRDGGDARLVAVPEKSFLLSPALPPNLTDADRELEASLAPLPLPLRSTITAFFSALLAVLACAAYLLWAYDRLPFLPRSPGPFARSWRRWRRRGRRELSNADRLTLLRDWHEALGLAAGETVYAGTLSRLFVRAPYLEPLRGRVEGVFSRSWQSFYGADRADEPAAAEILELLRESARRERGAAC